MKIKKDSWHYQLQKITGITNPQYRTNLCMYIRGLLITMLLPPLVVLVPFVLFVLTMSFGYSIVITGIGVGVVVLIIIDLFNEKIVPHLPSLPKRKQNKLKEPKLIIEYLKAKKQKICPLIEFEE